MLVLAMLLFVDDERVPDEVDWIAMPSGPWHIVRSCEDAILWVVQNGFPTAVSFDHDLGTRPDGSIAKTGYDFARWLIEHDLDTNAMPQNFAFWVRSKNPVGAENIRALLHGYLRTKS